MSGYTELCKACSRGGHLDENYCRTVARFPARVVLEVEVGPERVEQAVDRVYRRVVRDLRIPGFRRGTAPRKIVEMYVGKEALLQEAIEDLVPDIVPRGRQGGRHRTGSPRRRLTSLTSATASR